MATLVNRMVRAARLEPGLYEEVEADTTATGQAMTVVVLASVAAGIGNIFSAGVSGMVSGVISALLAWAMWAGLTFFIGTRILPEPETKADWGQLLRTLGFASAPGVLNVFGFIPVLGALLSLVVAVWTLAAFVIAVRQALDYKSTGRAIAVCIVGFFVYLGVMIVVAIVFGGMGVIANAG